MKVLALINLVLAKSYPAYTVKQINGVPTRLLVYTSKQNSRLGP